MQILTIAGNVGKDPVLRTTQGGDSVLSFSLAVDNGKDANGTKRDAVWFDCSLWGKRATALQSHITKGSKLALSGRPTARAHEGKAYLGITVDNLTFQGGGESRGNSGGGYDQSPQSGQGAPYGGGRNDGYQQQGGAPAGGAGRVDDLEDSIPFSMEWRI